MANLNRREYQTYLRKQKKRKPLTDEELLLSAQASLARGSKRDPGPRKPAKDNSLHNGRRWSLIDGKKIYHD